MHAQLQPPATQQRNSALSRWFRQRLTGSTLPFLILFQIFAAPVFAQVSVLTQHNDNARTGQNTSESILTTSNVNSSQFGKLFALRTDGQVYAQPLYVANLAIPGKGTHNVLFVATEGDTVYALDADSNTGANSSPLWKASLIDSAHGASAGETPLNTSSTIGCSDLQPQIGITSTPVIDLPSGTLYVEAKSVTGSTYIHRLHALDISTGSEKLPGPVVINATVPGSGDGSSGGNLPFDSLHQMNRPGLLLSKGTIFLAFASHCDFGPYHGWLFAYDQASFQQKGVFNTTPNGGLGGFWMSGAGVAAEASGNMYLATGNGTFSQGSPLELGDSILKFTFNGGKLSLADYFTPFNQDSLNGGDIDLGSGGVLLLPDQPGTHKHTLIQAGKEGRVYLVDRDALTNNMPPHFCSGCSSDPEIVQESGGGQLGGMWAMPAYWNNITYWWGSGDVLKAIPLLNGSLDFAHQTSSFDSYGFPGATPSISANGNSNGIVWSIDSSQYGSPGPGPGPAVLHAHDAANVSRGLYTSAQAANNRDAAGNAVKFAVPTIANGKVYVGVTNEVDVYGLLNATAKVATPAISPGSGTFANSVTVSIADSTPASSIFYTTSGATPTPGSTKYTGSFVLSSSSTVKAIATASGFSNSDVASAAYTITKAPIVYEPERLPAVSSGPVHRVFNWPGFTDGVGTILDATKVGDNVIYTLSIATSATYDVRVGVKKFPTRGIWQLSVNGANVGPTRDEFASTETFTEFDLGNLNISASGSVQFKFTITGHNAGSRGFTEAFDYIKLTPQ